MVAIRIGTQRDAGALPAKYFRKTPAGAPEKFDEIGLSGRGALCRPQARLPDASEDAKG